MVGEGEGSVVRPGGGRARRGRGGVSPACAASPYVRTARAPDRRRETRGRSGTRAWVPWRLSRQARQVERAGESLRDWMLRNSLGGRTRCHNLPPSASVGAARVGAARAYRARLTTEARVVSPHRFREPPIRGGHPLDLDGDGVAPRGRREARETAAAVAGAAAAVGARNARCWHVQLSGVYAPRSSCRSLPSGGR